MDVAIAAAGVRMVPRELEPRTLRLLAVRSNQLSYETSGIHSKQALIALYIGIR